ncbi:MAG: hypothetical protein IT165_30335 [Bryobacterales bacterium]|nr:hypothetical protein [Bryobacterales bacterium]
MGLIQSVVERSGIPTVSVTVLREITERVGPPRALFVDRPLGYPLGAPNDRVAQRRLIVTALSLLESGEERPFVKEYKDG